MREKRKKTKKIKKEKRKITKEMIKTEINKIIYKILGELPAFVNYEKFKEKLEKIFKNSGK